MELVRIALARIRAEPKRAEEVLRDGFTSAPEIFIPGIAYFVSHALQGEVIDPERLPDPGDFL
jgi:hypothetical protein